MRIAVDQHVAVRTHDGGIGKLGLAGLVVLPELLGVMHHEAPRAAAARQALEVRAAHGAGAVSISPGRLPKADGAVP